MLGASPTIPGFVALNTALQVGLDGSVNVERVRGRLVAGMGGHPGLLRRRARVLPTACRSSLCVRRTADGQRSCLRSKPSRHHDATSTSSSPSTVWLTCAASTTPNVRTESSESPRPNIAPSSSMDSRRRRSTHDEPGRSGCHRHRRGPRAGTPRTRWSSLDKAPPVVVNDLGVGIHGERESGGVVAVVSECALHTTRGDGLAELRKMDPDAHGSHSLILRCVRSGSGGSP